MDSKNCRMQEFIPGTIADIFGKMVQVQKLYIIKNFHVKEYKDEDKYRPVQRNKQLIFTIDTKVKEIAETGIFIPKNMFDFFKFEDIIKLSKQHVYLVDVIGIAKKKDVIGKLSNFTNSLGKQQTNIKFKISDGKRKIKVTFWDSFAIQFENAMMDDLEEPVIVIIASAKVSSWRDQTELCNYSPTKFYLNYDHHSVKQLRKKLEDPNFSKHDFSNKRKIVKVCTIAEIKKLPEMFIEEEVVCKANIKWAEETKTGITEFVVHVMKMCKVKKENTVVKNVQGKFWNQFQDETGVIEIVIKDREIRSLLGNNFEQFEIEDKDYPKIRELLSGKDYTMKLLIKEDKIKLQDIVYEETYIFLGFNLDEEMLDPQQGLTNRDSFTGEPSGSSYNLDEISQLNNQ
ncbi:hypothetical protein POM88_043881 [Heracleum sosnowskyi]|uniref:Replication protein A OB domain-containing protein n=1 Tax=Heracleum sosnowskyi TaxID=360622 RepID=A0AAD8H1S6_9APIA|nr:hypothetical protein POM88_043881 [Heracleum sosnowskyi]